MLQDLCVQEKTDEVLELWARFESQNNDWDIRAYSDVSNLRTTLIGNSAISVQRSTRRE